MTKCVKSLRFELREAVVLTDARHTLQLSWVNCAVNTLQLKCASEISSDFFLAGIISLPSKQPMTVRLSQLCSQKSGTSQLEPHRLAGLVEEST